MRGHWVRHTGCFPCHFVCTCCDGNMYRCSCGDEMYIHLDHFKRGPTICENCYQDCEDFGDCWEMECTVYSEDDECLLETTYELYAKSYHAAFNEMKEIVNGVPNISKLRFDHLGCGHWEMTLNEYDQKLKELKME